MKFIFIPFFILLHCCLQAQHPLKRYTTKKTISFPYNFVGNWTGTMIWYPNNAKTPVSVPVSLEVQSIKDSANQYTWKIEYGVDKKDIRPYILKKADTVKNHWVIDENNGIVLDSYWLGSRFSGVFSVNNQVILDSYWLEGKELHFEFFSYSNTPANSSTIKEDKSEPLTVQNYKLNSYQKGVLKKVVK